ncbi:Protein tyrosine/serine phosphatase [Micromonospora purpureochromogenes]|uniref:Protein tyrosine/serine phosphatase n=1 Tax=Micromonospora purpureochromogenes TaxID=47872 RepID=A0A1C5A441_9ACTN|nr:tyrosine-protein phosphatase [Micromonospora purpureochromogenes]SCF39985.1 Protein tyrosine/serine phosphatase [Micromonospora purpureochromogenes]
MDAIEVNRSIPFSAMFNFRDVGGYPGHDGRTVRWGRLYRSDSPHRLDGADRDAFVALGIRTVIDLRRPSEVERDGRVPELDGLTYRHIHPEHADWAQRRYEPGSDLARYLADRYADLAQTGTAGLAEAVGLIADSATAPVVVHCVAGKDRTGIVCALTLSVLGVSDADIVVDYALSSEASARFSAWLAATAPQTEEPPPPFLASPAEAMALFLTELRQGHGSVEGYLRHAGVTDDQLAALRDHLLD